ncbi:hypothetical protein CL616_01335 [archaeon]|nr:hypothetical protein [archaeon]|tara:strand:- start:200 stop:538 length:339 start_codon:yes stop_codon:yes gene_type:complete
MKELEENIISFWRGAEEVYKIKEFTVATTLYFKCLFITLDLIIFNKQKQTPKDHTERFRILQEEFPNYYLILDKLFEIYRNTYSAKITQENCEKVRDNVIKITKEQRIQLDN